MKKRFAHETALLALLFALLAYAKFTEPKFLALDTQRKLLEELWELALISIPMTLIILTGGIDLSVGSAMGLCAVVMGMSFQRGYPPALCALLALVAGLAAGALNGFFITRVKVHPLLVTLATLAAFRGVAEGMSGGASVEGFVETFKLLRDPVPALIFVAFVAIAAWFLNAAPGGVWLRAIGFNETSARFSGLPVDRLKLRLYALSGLAAGVAAVLYAARFNTAKADIGDGKELEAVTAVVLGGTSIFGGRGHVFGTVLGLLLIHETREFVKWHWSNEYIAIVLGVLLILSVLMNRFLGDGES